MARGRPRDGGGAIPVLQQDGVGGKPELIQRVEVAQGLERLTGDGLQFGARRGALLRELDGAGMRGVAGGELIP